MPEDLLKHTIGNSSGLADVTRTPQAVTILVVFCLLLFLPGITAIPPLDRDEPRFTQATKQMLETGDLVDIRFQDEARHKKPVGIYWLQAASVSLFGGDRTDIWKYRMVSFVGALAGVLLTFWMARAFLTPEPAFLAALSFGATLLLGVEAHIAKTDAMLLACIVAAQGFLARIWLAPGGAAWAAIGFWICVALGILIKGPIILLVSGGTVLALAIWERNVSWLLRLRPLTGLAVLMLVAAPWYIAITLRTDGAFFQESVGQDFLGKLATGQESHGAPPGTHFAVMLATFWPAAPLLAVFLPGIRSALGSPAVRFALCWALPSWLVFELTATKLPHYVLPIFPALTLILATLWSQTDENWRIGRWVRLIAGTWLVAVPVALFAGSIVVPIVLGNDVTWLATGLFAGATGAAVLAARALGRSDVMKSGVLGAVTAAFVSVGAYGLALPGLSAIWVSSAIVETARSNSACPDPRIASVGWREPSLIFLAGTDTALKLPEGAIDEAERGDCLVLAVESRDRERFLASVAATSTSIAEIGAVEGFALNGGDPVRITLYQPEAPAR